MIVTERTRTVLRAERIRKRLKASGWMEVGERGGELWKLYRGEFYDHLISEVAIDPYRKSLWIKHEAKAP